ncbi:hypothetical protein [Phaffia rhodozyma]|uniref:L-ornithine N(5)-monooxygenase n=1 Tax=Phaffia rhodozyma TaxID=264483 RepID=A0A0F7SJC6_PHARH|nr:hypothetical protein [Phaffia rhodozyma]
MLDIFIIGAGPHSLAAVSRLYEDTPSALYSDFEHARLHWLRKHAKPGKTERIVPDDVAEGRESPSKQRKTPQSPSRTKNDVTEKRPKVMVMDKQAARFMGTWDTFFDAFKIKHLRSPLFFHPHPGDLDALKSYAHANDRAKALIEIENVVGTEWSKHQKKAARIKGKAPQQPHINLRDISDYFIPSTPLFKSFIHSEVIERYSLQSIVQKGLVTSVKYHAHSDPTTRYSSDSLFKSLDDSDSYFTIESGDGQVFHSKAVIMSIGPGGIPNVPDYLSGGRSGMIDGEGWCHTAAFLKPGRTLLPKEDVRLTEKITSGKGGTLLVIGGGLTSVQIADLALSNGFTKVVFVARSFIKVKPFDIGIEWVGKYSNLLKMMFYQEDDPSARLNQFRTARNGGSVPAAYYKLLQSHAKAGKLDLRTQTTIQSLVRDTTTGTWSVEVEHRCLKKAAVKCPRMEKAELRANGK